MLPIGLFLVLVFSSDAVHQHARRNGEDEEPEKHERRTDVGLHVSEREVFFHIIGGDAHEVDESHDKETEHHGHSDKSGWLVVHNFFVV